MGEGQAVERQGRAGRRSGPGRRRASRAFDEGMGARAGEMSGLKHAFMGLRPAIGNFDWFWRLLPWPPATIETRILGLWSKPIACYDGLGRITPPTEATSGRTRVRAIALFRCERQYAPTAQSGHSIDASAKLAECAVKPLTLAPPEGC
jgi:hypothetical protein